MTNCLCDDIRWGKTHICLFVFTSLSSCICFRKKLFLMCIIVHTAAQGRQNQRGSGGLQEGKAIAGLDLGRIRNKSFFIKDLVFLLAPFRFSYLPTPLRFLLLHSLSGAKVNGACNTLEALFSF